MMKKQIKNNVFWVGKNDWELRNFHGYEYSTHKGSSYNSFLILEDKKILIDTVFQPFAKEFIEGLAKVIDLSQIDYVVVNHSELDHSGALPYLMELIPNTPIYCTEHGVKSIKGHFHKDWNFRTVKTGDKISLGKGKELVFIQAPMLHWPDSMFCYLTGDNILFSNDAFGQHYCSELLFNDLVNQHELFTEAIKYYANILVPFSHLVAKKIEEVLNLKLPIDIICPSHGVMWRDNPLQIVTQYEKWASNYQENQITIIYDTMYNGTRSIAENIAKGINSIDSDVILKLYNSATNDKNDIVTDIFKSKIILIGSPTLNNGIMHSIAGLLEIIKGLKFKGKKAASFGCYGWHDKSTKIINDTLQESGFELLNDGLNINWHPDKHGLEQCINYGRSIIERN